MALTAVVLQARLDSSRLPNKALLPLGGRPLIFRVMEALKQLRADTWILASTEDCAASFGPLAEEAGFSFLAGPKEDVLGRYCLAIRRFGIDRVIRATGDNPFVFADAAEAINAEAAGLDADYAGYSGLPYGAGVESVAARALLRAGEEAAALSEREHVCPYLYNHPDFFLLHRPLVPSFWRGPSLRLTVDTEDDYRRASALYTALDSCPARPGLSPEARYRGASIIAVAGTLP
ncbi:MAG: NTP transferase domain-containing protein [Treponema sp.]|jgi:spore coat polysaccharide biosynthesis protein SpsF|nr:NTP transferase domain-containing protein [Treponema sp.]